jgi:hypothetical protein
MLRLSWIAAGICLVLATCPADAATVEGTITYDGELVTAAFGDITGLAAHVYDYDTSQRITGTVDAATSTYVVTGLPVGHTLAVFAEVDRSDPTNGSAFDPGDLQSGSIAEITDPSQTVTVDIGVRTVMRLRSPFDSTGEVQDNALTCPIGFETPSPAQLRWDEVPRAQSYQVVVSHRTCDHVTLSTDRYDVTEATASVPFGIPDEDYTLIMIQCAGEVSTNLCFVPYVAYLDNSVQAILLRRSDIAPGERGTHHTDAFFLPAVASAPGVAPTYWTSSVTVTSLVDFDSPVRFYFTPAGVDGGLEFLETELNLHAGSTMAWRNIVLSLFGLDGVGSLEIRGTGISVASRTSTPGDEGGSYGQGIPTVGPDQVLRVDRSSSATLGSVTENAEFRSNLGLCETWGESATVRITVADATGDELGSRTVNLRPYENTQINRLVRNVTSLSTLENGVVTVKITAGAGRVAAYLSTVDNATGDPTYLAVAPSRPTGG